MQHLRQEEVISRDADKDFRLTDILTDGILTQGSLFIVDILSGICPVTDCYQQPWISALGYCSMGHC